MSQTAKRLARANLVLDNACKRAGLDPTEVRTTMANTIKDALEKQENGSGFARQKPYIHHRNAVGECHE